MDKTKNKSGIALVAVLALAAIMLASAVLTASPARAQSKPSTAGYGAGLPRLHASGTTSIAAGTPAVLISAVTTGGIQGQGQKIIVKSMKLWTVTTGGLVSFYDGPNAANFLDNAYVPVSSPTSGASTDVPETQLGPGFRTSVGSPLCAQLNGCTLVWDIQYQLE